MTKSLLPFTKAFGLGNKPSEATEPEQFYHEFVLGLILGWLTAYTITSNREEAASNFMMVRKPRNVMMRMPLSLPLHPVKQAQQIRSRHGTYSELKRPVPRHTATFTLTMPLSADFKSMMTEDGVNPAGYHGCRPSADRGKALCHGSGSEGILRAYSEIWICFWGKRNY